MKLSQYNVARIDKYANTRNIYRVLSQRIEDIVYRVFPMIIAFFAAFASVAVHAETRSISLKKPDHTVIMQLQAPGPITSATFRRLARERDRCMHKFGYHDASDLLDSAPSDAQIQPIYACMMGGYAKAGVHVTYRTEAMPSQKSATRNR